MRDFEWGLTGMHLKIVSVLVVSMLQFGCAERYVYQAPAPVYRSQDVVVVPEEAKTVTTYKYPEIPAPEAQPKWEEVATPEAGPLVPLSPPVLTPEVPALPSTAVAPVPPPAIAADVTPPVPPLPAEPVVPVEPPLSTASFSPAILALANEADQSFSTGQLDSAAVKIERALRIDPRNAVLTYKLASIRLKQEQPRLAEDLAKKAALLAGSDRDIKKRSWLLIAAAKRLQKDPDGALFAEQKAAQF
jgi:tetratricopeptide (TPR) repeat protein